MRTFIQSKKVNTTALLIVALVFFAVTSTVTAGGISSARSVAMGGAYIGLAKGVDAARYNPANLGLSDYQQRGLELAGVGAHIRNNSFTLDDYNTYTGAFLTDDDKNYILGQIPDEGLKMSADLEAAALGFTTGQMAFSVTGVGVADINLNRDLVDLILNGNTIADTINVTGSYSDMVGYVSGGLSYGQTILSNRGRELSVGATFKYIKGLAIERVVELQGLATTTEVGFAGQGSAVFQTATGGSGYAVDLGAAVKLNSNYTAGICVKNILSHINWNNETEEHGYLFEFDSMTVENFDNEEQVTSEDYSEPIGDFSTSVPSVMTIGLAKTSGKLIWAIDYEQGFRKEAAGASTKPRIAAGMEYALLSSLPLRLGFTTGGTRNTAVSFGSGFRSSIFYLDFAAVVGSTFSGYSAKGANLALTTGILF